MLNRKQCCNYFDGRPNEWHGFACIPSQNGSDFLSGNVCEPTSYADQHPAHRGTCPDDPPSVPLPDDVIDGSSAAPAAVPAPAKAAQPQNPWIKLEEPRIAVSHGCFTLEQNECCDYFDGRPDEWNGQSCIPSLPSLKFQSGNVCEPSTYADQHPEQSGVCREDSASVPSQDDPKAPAEVQPSGEGVAAAKGGDADDLSEEERDEGIVIDGTIPAKSAPPSTPSPLAADMGESAPMAEVHEAEGEAVVLQPSPVSFARLEGQRHSASRLARLVQAEELCAPERALNFSAALVSHSNLGGAGPDAGEETLVFENIAFAGGAAVDLVVSATSPYAPNDALKNGARGGFGVINLRVNTAADLLFRFVDRHGAAVEMEPFLFTVFDIDQGMSHTSRETVTLSGVSSFEVAEETELAIQTLTDDTFSFTSSLRGGKVDNPVSPMSLSKTQEERSVAATLPKASEFAVSFADVRFAKDQGRNFLFAGTSSMSCRREHGCNEYNCPDGYHLRTMAEFLVCAGRRCEESDRDTCCYAEPVDQALGLLL